MLAANGAYLALYLIRRFARPVSGCTAEAFRFALPSLSCVGEPAPGQLPEGCTVGFDRQAVARQFALSAVQSAAAASANSGGSVDTRSVMEAWQERMPPLDGWPSSSAAADSAAGDSAVQDAAAGGEASDGSTAEAIFVGALAGVAIQQPGMQGTRLLALVAEQLSLDAKTRFAQLFAAKPKWSADEIAPYLAGVHAEGCKNASELLLKFTRAIREGADAPALHCAR